MKSGVIKGLWNNLEENINNLSMKYNSLLF